jgi:hypothetical protein
MSETSPVTRDSLRRLFPISAPAPMTVLPTRTWTQHQWQRIQRGYRAQSMDEKWLVFAEGRVVFLHRSWTGHGVFEATFSPVDGGWQISAAVAESDRDRARLASPEYSRVTLELVLSAIVLGESATELRAELVRLSRPADRPAPPPGLIEHSALGERSDP